MKTINKYLLLPIFFCATMAMVSVSQAWGVCTDPPANLVSWWSGNSHPLDLIGLNNGALSNGATYASGKVSEAFSLEGNDETIVMSTSALKEAYTALTIDAWVYPTAHGHAGLSIFGKTIISKTQFDGFALRVYDGYLQPDFRLSSGLYRVLFNTQELPLNTWSHVAVTYDGANIRGYYNGAAFPTVTPATGTLTNTINSTTCLMIGNEPVNCAIQTQTEEGTANFAWSGRLDEIQFFDRALSQAEIQAIYNAGSDGKCLDLTPDPFAFNDINGATSSTPYVSNTITVNGLKYNAPISIVGGEYSINGGDYTSTLGTVTNGNTVAVKQTSSASSFTTTDAVLTIGTLSDTYRVTTGLIQTYLPLIGR